MPAASGSFSRPDANVGANVYSTISGDYANIDAHSAANTQAPNTSTSSIIAQTDTPEGPRYAVPRMQSVYEAMPEGENDVTAATGSGRTPANSSSETEDATGKECASTGPSEQGEGYEMALQASGKVASDVSPCIDRRGSSGGYQVALKVVDPEVNDVKEEQGQGTCESGYEVPQKENISDGHYVAPDYVTKETIATGEKRPVSENSVYIFMGSPLPTK